MKHHKSGMQQWLEARTPREVARARIAVGLVVLAAIITLIVVLTMKNTETPNGTGTASPGGSSEPAPGPGPNPPPSNDPNIITVTRYYNRETMLNVVYPAVIGTFAALGLIGALLARKKDSRAMFNSLGICAVFVLLAGLTTITLWLSITGTGRYGFQYDRVYEDALKDPANTYPHYPSTGVYVAFDIAALITASFFVVGAMIVVVVMCRSAQVTWKKNKASKKEEEGSDADGSGDEEENQNEEE